MPSSGYGMVNLINEDCESAESITRHTEKARYLEVCARTALDAGLFTEWLSCFIAAWDKTKDDSGQGDVSVASDAGIIEWDI